MDAHDDFTENIGETEISESKGIKPRETWGRKLDFFLSCVGSAVGLGNVWRFPYLCYKNGGGAFLIPFFLAALVGGIPIFYLEIAVGQFMSQGGPQAWSIVPLLQGIGLASTIIMFMIGCFYAVVLAWTFYYLFSSFTNELPWEKCDNDWNTPSCSNSNGSLTIANTSDPVTEFWENKVLGISEGLEQFGQVKWDLALCLLLASIIVYLCVCKGIKCSGKVMYVTATAPYIFMIILAIRNCTLDGSEDGIEFYLKPNLTKLSETTVWLDAGNQIVFSWGIGMGVLTMLGSYNKFRHNSLRDAVAFSLVNAGTSFLAGFIVFTILGFMAKQQGVLVSDVAESGPGLAFIAYPKAVAQLPLSPLWSVLFFVMLILLGLDTQFTGIETVMTAIVDQYPRALRKGYRREMSLAALCIAMYLISLLLVTEGGVYVLQIFDHYIGSRILILIALFELAAISFLYGIRRFIDNIRMMIGDTCLTKILPYFQICWFVISPIFCLMIFGLTLHDLSPLTYQRPNRPKYFYPEWSVAIGWLLATIGVIGIPLVAIYRVIRLVRMGGRLSQGDFRMLLVPYALSEHQRRPQDRYERCLADFETKRQKKDYTLVLQKTQNGLKHEGDRDTTLESYPV